MGRLPEHEREVPPVKIRIIAVAVLILAALTGCEAGPASDGVTGIVVDREVKSPRNGPDYYVITIKRDDSGGLDAGRVSKTTFDRCRVPEHWPTCKKG